MIQKVGTGNQVVALANTPSGARIIRQITPQIITGQAATAQIVGQQSTPQIIVGGQQSTPQLVVAGQQSTPQLVVAGQQGATGIVVGGQTNLIQKQQQLQQQKQLLAAQQAQLQQIQALQQHTVKVTTAGQTTVQALGQTTIQAMVGGQPQTITVTPQQLAALQQQQQIKVRYISDSQTDPAGQTTV